MVLGHKKLLIIKGGILMIKFDRMEIANINNAQIANNRMNSTLQQNKTIAVPRKETFNHVFKNAKERK